MTRAPRIFFHCYDHQRRLGGQKHTYAQVDALNEHGFDAYAVHGRDGFRLQWFQNHTRAIGPSELAQLYDRSLDIWVLPEDFGDRIDGIAGRKVIFNKGIYNGFSALDLEEDRATPYESPNVVAALAVSTHNAEILRFAFPNLPVHVTRPGIDVERFAETPLSQKRRQIAWVGKNPTAMNAMRHVLSSRARQGAGALSGFRWVRLADLTEDQMITALKESLVFVFLGIEEGYGILPREAALCGCVTVAFDAGTLDGLCPRGRLVPGDILGAARLIEEVAAAFPERLGDWQAAVREARDEVARMSIAAAAGEAVAAWTRIFAGLGVSRG